MIKNKWILWKSQDYLDRNLIEHVRDSLNASLTSACKYTVHYIIREIEFVVRTVRAAKHIVGVKSLWSTITRGYHLLLPIGSLFFVRSRLYHRHYVRTYTRALLPLYPTWTVSHNRNTSDFLFKPKKIF